MGVTSGFAGMKFSGSPNRKGMKNLRIDNINMSDVKPIISFTVKRGWNGVFDIFDEIPIGLFDPFWWIRMMWMRAVAAIINGRA